MKYYLLSFIPLILTLPMVGDWLLFGVPAWVWISLFFAVIYAIALVVVIDKKWDDLS